MACSAIMQSCILLGGAEFLSAHSTALVDMICKLLGNVKERGMLLLLPVMALMLCALPEQMPAVMQPALQCLLHILLTDQESTQVTGGAATHNPLLLPTSTPPDRSVICSHDAVEQSK